jgi:hypothetical protein
MGKKVKKAPASKLDDNMIHDMLLVVNKLMNDYHSTDFLEPVDTEGNLYI